MEVWRCNRKHQVSGGATLERHDPGSLKFSEVLSGPAGHWGCESGDGFFFLNPHIFENALEKNLCLHKAVFKKFPVYTEMLETTENDVVPMPGLVRRRNFTA